MNHKARQGGRAVLQVGQPVCVVEQGAEAAPAAEAPADDKPAEEKPKAEAKNVPAAEQKGDKPEAPPPPPPPKPKLKPEPSKAPAKARLMLGRSMFALSCANLLLGRSHHHCPSQRQGLSPLRRCWRPRHGVLLGRSCLHSHVGL